MRPIWAALFVMLAFSFTGCGAYQPDITVEPCTEFSKAIEECLADFKKEFPRKGRLVKDGYYVYGKLYTVLVDYTAAAPKDALYGAIKWATPVHGKMSFYLAVNTDGFVAIEDADGGAIVSKIQEGTQTVSNAQTVSNLLDKDYTRMMYGRCSDRGKVKHSYTEIKHTITDSSYIFKNFGSQSGTLSRTTFSWKLLVDKEFAEKYISPEEKEAQRKAEEEQRKKDLEFEIAMMLTAAQMFVNQSPFYHPRAEKLFWEWLDSIGMEDKETKKVLDQKFEKLNQNEQYEFKIKVAEYLRFIQQ